MNVGDYVQVYWIENGRREKDCMYGRKLGEVVGVHVGGAMVRVRNRYGRMVVRRFATERLAVIQKSLLE